MIQAKKNRQIDQRNRKESPEVNPHKYSQLIFDKESKATQGRKESFSTSRTTGLPMCKKQKICTELYPSQKLTQDG